MGEKKWVLYGLVAGSAGEVNQYHLLPEEEDDGRVWVMRIGDIPDYAARRVLEDGERVQAVWPELIGLPFQVIAGEDTDAPDTVPAIFMPDR